MKCRDAHLTYGIVGRKIHHSGVVTSPAASTLRTILPFGGLVGLPTSCARLAHP